MNTHLAYGKYIESLHRALYRACGLPDAALKNYMQLSQWSQALAQYEPFQHHTDFSDPISEQDITALVRELERQNDYEKKNWSLMPSKILSNLAAGIGIDIILEIRKKAARRKARAQARPAAVSTPSIPSLPSPPSDPESRPLSHEEHRSMFDALREKLTGIPRPSRTPDTADTPETPKL